MCQELAHTKKKKPTTKKTVALEHSLVEQQALIKVKYDLNQERVICSCHDLSRRITVSKATLLECFWEVRGNENLEDRMETPHKSATPLSYPTNNCLAKMKCSRIC